MDPGERGVASADGRSRCRHRAASRVGPPVVPTHCRTWRLCGSPPKDIRRPAKPSDPTWNLLPGAQGANTPFFTSGQTWYQVFWTNPKGGSAYYILAHQYMAAKLNILAGAASTPQVDATIAWAETFFGTYGPNSTLSKAVRQQAIAAAGLLGS